MHQRQPNLFSIAAMALIFLESTAAVSLDDFTPRASNLPSACEKLYSSDIDGCQASDFTGGKCSSTCLAALDTLTASVKVACVNGVTGDNIINAMVHNQGVSRICPNAGSGDADSSAASFTSTSTTAKQSETPVIGGGTMVLSSDAPSATDLVVDTSTPTSTKSAAKSSETVSTETSGTKTLLTTMTIQPVQATTSSASSDDMGILHDATTGSATATTSYIIESSATSSSKNAKQTSSDDGGSPFDESSEDSTSGSGRVVSSVLALVPATLLSYLLW